MKQLSTPASKLFGRRIEIHAFVAALSGFVRELR